MLDIRSAGRFVLNATLPRIIQRRILRMLPPELGRYLLDGGAGISTHGEIGELLRPKRVNVWVPDCHCFRCSGS
jgi:hypothetical protein